jgi:hypothetical protein
LSVALRPDFSSVLKPFAVIGAHPVRHNSNGADRVMQALQLGSQWQVSDKTNVRLAVARYKTKNAVGVPSADRFSPTYLTSEYESGFRQRGNTLFRINQDPFVNASPVYGLASEFDVQAITASAELTHFAPIGLMVMAESIINKGFKEDAVAQRVGFSGIAKRNKGHLFQITLGHRAVIKPQQWQLGVGLRKLERDATIDAFTDPDFVLGGTNVRGQTMNLSYGIANNTSLGLRFLTGRTIDPPFGDPSAEPLRVKTLQFDLNVRF